MRAEDRKKQIAYCEEMLKAAHRKQNLSNTLVRRWSTRLRNQEKAYQRELEQAAALATAQPADIKRRFR